MSSREETIQQQYSRAVSEIVEQLPNMAEVFRNPRYDIKKAVDHDLDCLLGAVLASILERYNFYCLNRGIMTTGEEADKFNYLLFSRANEFKDMIRKATGV